MLIFGLQLNTFHVLFMTFNPLHFPEHYAVFKVRFDVVTSRPSGYPLALRLAFPAMRSVALSTMPIILIFGRMSIAFAKIVL